MMQTAAWGSGNRRRGLRLFFVLGFVAGMSVAGAGCGNQDPPDRSGEEDVRYQVTAVTVTTPTGGNACQVEPPNALVGTTLEGVFSFYELYSVGEVAYQWTLSGLELEGHPLKGHFGIDMGTFGTESFEEDYSPTWDCVVETDYWYEVSAYTAADLKQVRIDVYRRIKSGSECAMASSEPLSCDAAVTLDLTLL